MESVEGAGGLVFCCRCCSIITTILLLALTPPCTAAVTTNIGINYGQVANNLPTPQRVVQLIRSTSIRKVKLYDANSLILSAFANSNVEFIVGVKNEEITSLLDSQVALKWASENVFPYMQSAPVKIISVGNQILTTTNISSSVHTQLVTVMENLQAALVDLKLSNRVFISTTHSMAILNQSFPPSSGAFREEITKPVMLPLLRFLNRTGAPLMVNIYPYFAYKAKPLDISLSYALFQPNNGVTDPKTKLHYDNLFDAQVDAVYSAMAKLGFTNIPVLVSETGWPSNGSPIELGASVANAMTYNRNLVKHIQSGAGTPLKPKQDLVVYIFALFNENKKPGPTSQRYFGLFRPEDLSLVYDIGIVQGHATPPTGSPTIPIPRPPSPVTIPIPRPPSPLTIPIPRPPSPLTIPIPRPPPPIAIRRPPPSPVTIPIPRPPLSPHRPPSPPPVTIPVPTRKPPPPPPPAMSTCPPTSPVPTPSSPPSPTYHYPPPNRGSIIYPYPPPPPRSPAFSPPVIPYPPVRSPPPIIVHPAPTFPPPVVVYPPPTSSPPPVVVYPPPTSSPPPVVVYPPPTSSPPPVVVYPAPTLPPPVAVYPSPPPATPGPGQGSGGTRIWCVARPGGDAASLLSALNYACGEGGADCSAIQPGGSCYEPNNVDSHASYAFNSYYQKHGRNYWNCYFDGNGLVTVSDPSTGSCVYPSQ